MQQEAMELAELLFNKGVIILVAVIIALVIQHIAVRLAHRVLDASNVPSVSILINILRGLIWFLALLSVMEPVFGVAPSYFVATLGVVSVAVSLGLQDTISNIIGGLSLMLAHVIKPGDEIAVGSVTGEVTDVTWRSTTVRNRSGAVEVIPNSVLNKTSLTRRIPFEVGRVDVPFDAVQGADLTAITNEILPVVEEALGEYRDPAIPTLVLFSSMEAYGIKGTIIAHVNKDIMTGVAADKIVRALEGKPWIASALNNN